MYWKILLEKLQNTVHILLTLTCFDRGYILFDNNKKICLPSLKFAHEMDFKESKDKAMLSKLDMLYDKKHKSDLFYLMDHPQIKKKKKNPKLSCNLAMWILDSAKCSNKKFFLKATFKIKKNLLT